MRGESHEQLARPVELLFATDALCIDGRTYAGLPLLVGADGYPVEPAQTYLWHLLTAGRPCSALTWRKYGRTLFDYFAFVDANHGDWRAPSVAGRPCMLMQYRDWSRGTTANEASTVNARVRLLCRFYEWALETRHIVFLPYGSTARSSAALRVVDPTEGRPAAPRRRGRSALTLAQWHVPLRFTTAAEAEHCLERLGNPTHNLMFRLMSESGLRQCECRTFPVDYVFDPRHRTGLVYGERIRVLLKPSDMLLKNRRSRKVDVPYSLMEDLWWYFATKRNARAARGTSDSAALFLTEEGQPYSPSAMQDMFVRLEKRVGFYVRAHMLRHSYAIYLLRRLGQDQNFRGSALLYVRDRLGHSDVRSTQVYLAECEALDADLVNASEDELDKAFAS